MSAEQSLATDLAQKRARGLGWKLVASLIVALAFVWLLRAGALPVVPSERELARISAPHLVLAIALWAVNHAIRALRWQLLVASVAPARRAPILGAGLVGFAATMLLPLRTGEAVRPLLAARAGVSPWIAAGTVGAERVVDGAFVSVVLLGCLRVAAPTHAAAGTIGALPIDARIVPQAATLAATVFVAAFAVLLVLYRFRAASRRALDRLLMPLSPKLARAVDQRVEQVANGVGFLSQPRASIPFLLITGVYWLLATLGLWLLAKNSGFPALTFTETCAALGVLALGITVPNAPGLFGSFQLALYAGFLLYFPFADVQSAGAAVVFCMYVSQFTIHLLGGVVGWAILARR